MLQFLILAAHSNQNVAPVGKSMSVPWAIVGAAIIVGLAITLSPPRRTSEVKKPKDE
jgi:hypothetical protein